MVKNGAAAVVCEHDLGLENQVVVENTRAVYSEICANFSEIPPRSLSLSA